MRVVTWKNFQARLLGEAGHIVLESSLNQIFYNQHKDKCMVSWSVGFLVCCGLLIGCGGGPKGNLAVQDVGPVPVVQSSGPEDQEEFQAEQLSAQRLEELYAKSGIQGQDPTLEEELKKWDQRLKFDVPIHVNRQVKAYLVYFSTERKTIISKYLARSTRYLPLIQEVFQEHGLPEDLAYLAMVESGFNPQAYSHAHACGMWQFIRGTAARYGLEVNNYLDERRDPEKSTHAAAKYLLDLYKQFGSWYLAAASYNCGEGRVQREINASTHKNFWELSANQCLPNETKNYVPQMIAATIIAKNPEKFGFRNIPYLPPIKYDKVKVDEPTSLRAAAVAVNVPVDDLQVLNPELRRGVTPPEGAYTLKIPPGAAQMFAKNISVARIEIPAVASAPVRTVKTSYSRTASGKSTSSSKRAVARKGKGKSTVVASKKRQKDRDRNVQMASAAPAKSTKSAKRRTKQGKPVVLASMFGDGDKAASQSRSSSKGKDKKQSKYSKKNKRNKDKDKEKVSRNKSKARKTYASKKKGKTRLLMYSRAN